VRSRDNPISWFIGTPENEGASTARSRALPVLLVTGTVFLFASGSIAWLASRSVAFHDRASLANHIEVDAYRERAIDWQAFAAGTISPSLQRERDAIDLDTTEDANKLASTGASPEIASLFEVYDRDMEDEFAALSAGRITEAHLIQGRATGSFDAFARATHAATVNYHSAADRALVQGLIGSVLILLLGAVVVTLTHGRSERAQARARARLQHQASHDALTGLPNRGLLTNRLQRLLLAKARTGAETALLLVDLDRFRYVNETIGHDCGDELLIKVGDRLRGALDEADSVARLGGDEFAILLPRVAGIEAALLVADRLQMALGESFEVAGLDLDIEARIGVVVSGRDGDDVLTLFRHADIATSVAKKRGITVATYEQEANESSPGRLTLLRELRHALNSGDLVLHYQPKIDLGTREVVGVEALVRWNHPDRGSIPPDEFIPLAEHSGLIGPLTRYILNSALGQARRWIQDGTPMSVAVNLSARNLGDDQLPDQVAELLRAHEVPANLLTLEITESAIFTEPERAKALLFRLHVMGVKLSIDDFGTGYTSLGQLKTIPIAELKIDRSFVATMTSDSGNAHIVRGVVALGHNLGLAMVAEGVEDAETLTALTELGCDFAQGYLLARPMPVEDLDRWYSEYSSEARYATVTV
jgi:diguanylate cyclase (GGDEF)-like protein